MSSVGFIKLHRRLKDSDVFADSELFHIFSFCLLEAAWEPIDKPVGNKVVSLKVGQFITGRKKISRTTGIKESKIYRCLNTLEKLNIIEQQKTTKYSIISIVNWSKYQHAEQQTNNKSTTNEQQKNTVKEVKKKEEKKYSFEEFWNIFGYKSGRKQAEQSWNKINLDDILYSKILSSAKKECDRRPGMKADNKTPKMAQGWLTDERWDDDIYTAGSSSSINQKLPDAEYNDVQRRLAAAGGGK